MRNLLYTLVILSFTIGCKEKAEENSAKKSHPSHKYHFVNTKPSDLNYHETLYVPVYSDIYYKDGTLRYHLTATVSIRNISLNDTAYVFNATYYDSYGNKLREYADSTIMVSPLESFELVVEEVEKIGGAGANFIVDWGATKSANQLLVQSVMIGATGQQGVSFLSEAKIISQQKKEK